MFPRNLKRVLDLRYSFAKLAAFAPGDDDDADDNDDDDGGGDGSSGTDADGNDGKPASGGKPEDKTIKDPEKKRLSDEAAKHRNAAKQAAKERDDLATKLKAIEDKDKSELELAQSTLKEVTDRAEKAEALAESQGVELAFFKSGTAALFRDQEVALGLLRTSLKDLKPDEDGEYPSDEFRKAADTLLKAKPYLAAENSLDDDDDGEKPTSGRPLNGKKPTKDSTAQALQKKFPALLSR